MEVITNLADYTNGGLDDKLYKNSAMSADEVERVQDLLNKVKQHASGGRCGQPNDKRLQLRPAAWMKMHNEWSSPSELCEFCQGACIFV